ncbi:HAMP domain-containing histidine kinase [bacterium]|nr:HAMP domain-containing histidine kinase [bacterium]
MTETQQDLNTQIRQVSHEIRNHLSICDMYSQILKKHIEKEGLKNDSINNALNCIQKSIQIISTNVLDLKSINSNHPQILDFKNTVIKSVEMSKAYISDKNIEFDTFIKNSANINVDENRFISCIINIIKNGIEAIDIKGKISIIGEVKEGAAILKISNNGKPIPPNKREEIFKQGYTTKQSGSGLGLHICKKYLESQNATISLTKSTKSETRFEITIPIC